MRTCVFAISVIRDALDSVERVAEGGCFRKAIV